MVKKNVTAFKNFYKHVVYDSTTKKFFRAPGPETKLFERLLLIFVKKNIKSSAFYRYIFNIYLHEYLNYLLIFRISKLASRDDEVDQSGSRWI